MLCPNCGEEDNRVIDTYPATDENATFRVRRCKLCDWVWRTKEFEDLPKKKRVLT
jgi:transcriptional regulator NrdR family protein